MEALRRSIIEHTGPEARALVAAYYEPLNPFAADTFDSMGGNDATTITGDDLAATALLDVGLPPLLIRATLRQQPKITEMLRAIDASTPLWRASDDLLGSVQRMSEWLQSFDRVGPVIASKLLARKRPHLVPIFDSVVKERLVHPRGEFWTTLREALRDDHVRRRIDSLTPPAPPRPSTLRLLDVAVWMSGSRSTNARQIRDRLDLEQASG